jgi:hypothetical protein
MRLVFAVTAVAVGLPAPDAFAQHVSFGVVVGGYANRDFDSRYIPNPGFLPSIVHSDSGGYIIGPSVAFRLHPRLSLGAEALYKPLHYNSYGPATVVTWQFPILARYSFRSESRVRPFIEAGPSFRTAGNLNSSNPSHFGVSAGLGAETQWRSVRIAPRVRYTRWAADPSWVLARTRSDQLEFLVGFSHAKTSGDFPLGRRISIGAVVGSTLLDDFAASTDSRPGGVTYQTSSVRSFVAGPLVEVSLSQRFSIEGNAITRSTRGVTKVLGACPTQEMRVCSWSFSSTGFWEFPVLAKYRLTTSSWRPFVGLGPAFRLAKEEQSSYGVTAGVGVETQWKRIKIAPVLRYTHWGPNGLSYANHLRNRVQVLVGASF